MFFPNSTARYDPRDIRAQIGPEHYIPDLAENWSMKPAAELKWSSPLSREDDAIVRTTLGQMCGGRVIAYDAINVIRVDHDNRGALLVTVALVSTAGIFVSWEAYNEDHQPGSLFGPESKARCILGRLALSRPAEYISSRHAHALGQVEYPMSA